MKRGVVALAAAAAIAGCAVSLKASPGVEAATPVKVSNTPVELRPGDPADTRLGKLVYRGGVSVTPLDNPAFGGVSALRVSPDGARFAAISDTGLWLTGALLYDASGAFVGIGDVTLAPQRGPEGEKLIGKAEGDAEGFAFADPFGLNGEAFVSYERHHRVMRFDFGKDGVAAVARPFPMPRAIGALSENAGLEVLASLGDGRLVAMAEEGPGGENDDSPAWVIDIASGAYESFTVKRTPPYALTDGALLPDGRFLTVERRFSVLTGPGAQFRVFDPAAFREGAHVDGELIGVMFGGVTVDNMECVAARRDENGRTFIYVASDDNMQRPMQRTLVMMFELVD